MKYLSDAAIRSEILEEMNAQDIDMKDLAQRLGMDESFVQELLSEGYEFAVWEILTILEALDSNIRFEVVPN